MNRCVFRCRLTVAVVLHSRISAGSEFQTDDAATLKACRARSALSQGTSNSAINDHHRGAAVSIDAAKLECTSMMKTGQTEAAVCQYGAEHSSRGKKRQFIILFV